MEYANVKEMRDAWLSGQFEYPEELTIAGVPYHFRSSSQQQFEDVVRNGKKAFVIYATPDANREDAKAAGMNQWIVMIWGMDDKSHVRPFDIRSTTPNRMVGNQVLESQERIGDVVILKVFLPSGAGALKGKVDTGAEISSLHADNIEVLNGTVRFVNKELSQNVISVPVVEKQAVSSADGGVEYRPVIEIDIEINGKPVRGALFNLNDRDHMEYPALIGQNVLEKTNFLVDPKIDDPDAKRPEQFESEEWVDVETITEEHIAALQEEFADVEPVLLEDAGQQEKVQALYQALQEANITFADLVRFIRTDARKVIEDIEY